MSYKIHIVDLDNVLHIGTKAGKMKDFNTKAFPTGGIYAVLRMLKEYGVLSYQDNYKIIFVYDKKTNYRKSIYPEYKGKRKDYKTEVDLLRDKAVRLQKDFLVENLPKAGFMVLGKDWLEADDIMFNIALNLAYNQSQPLAGEVELIVHSSDEDWLGILGLAPNIRFESTNSNSDKLNNVKVYGDYPYKYNNRPELHYLMKAIYGDTSDNYPGFLNSSVLNYEETLNCNNSNYWNYYYWEEVIKNHGIYNGELLDNILLNLRLAFPIYDDEMYQKDYLSELWNNRIDLSFILKITDLLRIKSLEKIAGKLGNYTEQHAKNLNTLKSKYYQEYKDVFEFYSKIEYEPKITTGDVDSVFDKYSNIKL